ncbi:MAG: sulfotransferase family 2 domain-containing protein [Mesonia sp.]|uniref:sulfotransferase family 2 domain-containing protein n=1 Tax=Mesonia sp. TaxID=1960830 RepID=UPI003241CABE
MISHKHKCIFIHIAKCAGTSIENAFGVDTSVKSLPNYEQLYGWDSNNQLWLQHARPQELIDLKLITKQQWDTYYKFIVYRNSWDKAISDYFWMKKTHEIEDIFFNYLNKKGRFNKILNEKGEGYSGDHLYLQKDYFFLDNKRINYNLEIDFDNLSIGFNTLQKHLNLDSSFFEKKLNSNKNKNRHYSFYYTNEYRDLVYSIFNEDIDFFNFDFINRKSLFMKIFNLKYDEK